MDVAKSWPKLEPPTTDGARAASSEYQPVRSSSPAKVTEVVLRALVTCPVVSLSVATTSLSPSLEQATTDAIATSWIACRSFVRTVIGNSAFETGAGSPVAPGAPARCQATSVRFSRPYQRKTGA